ncbi:hypothetical protein CHARACLAT_028421, partial [Characodon lateralis]|nr:hypothetical protein [Characodon lateralis]
MSGFSAELIDYLEGRITFEEFDRRRDECNTEESEGPTEDESKPSTSAETEAKV